MSHAVIKADVVLVLAQVIDLYISLHRERLGPAQTADDGGQWGFPVVTVDSLPWQLARYVGMQG